MKNLISTLILIIAAFLHLTESSGRHGKGWLPDDPEDYAIFTRRYLKSLRNGTQHTPMPSDSAGHTNPDHASVPSPSFTPTSPTPKRYSGASTEVQREPEQKKLPRLGVRYPNPPTRNNMYSNQHQSKDLLNDVGTPGTSHGGDIGNGGLNSTDVAGTWSSNRKAQVTGPIRVRNARKNVVPEGSEVTSVQYGPHIINLWLDESKKIALKAEIPGLAIPSGNSFRSRKFLIRLLELKEGFIVVEYKSDEGELLGVRARDLRASTNSMEPNEWTWYIIWRGAKLRVNLDRTSKQPTSMTLLPQNVHDKNTEKPEIYGMGGITFKLYKTQSGKVSGVELAL